MKINANEMLLMQNNLGAASRRNSVNKHFESPVPQTNYSMNALEAQGMNNMAFQGVTKSVSKPISNAVKILAGAAAGTLAMMSQSCDRYDPDKYLHMNESVTINTNTTVNNQITVNYNNVMDSVSHYQYDQNNPTLDSLLVEQKKTNDLLHLLVTSVTISNQAREDYMQVIINMYNEAMAKADDRDAAMEQFMADVRAYLEGILQNTNAIKIDLAAHKAESSQFYKDIKAEADSIKNDGRMTLNTTIEISEKMDLFKNMQDSILADGDSLVSLISNYYPDFIAILNGGTGSNINISKDDLQAMLNALGITVSQAISDSKDDLIAAIQNGVAAIVDNNNQNFADLKAELADIKLDLGDIIARMDTAKVQRDVLIQNSDSALVLLNKNNADNEDIKAALDSLNSAVNNLFNFVSTKSIQINDLDSLFKEYAFDKLAADVDTMKNIGKDFVAPVLTRVNQYIDYVMNIDTTYLDGSQKQMIKAILDKLNNLQVICQCQCNCGNNNTGNPNEGVGNPTGGDIGDLFSLNNEQVDPLKELLFEVRYLDNSVKNNIAQAKMNKKGIEPDKTYRIYDTNLFQA